MQYDVIYIYIYIFVSVWDYIYHMYIFMNYVLLYGTTMNNSYEFSLCVCHCINMRRQINQQ